MKNLCLGIILMFIFVSLASAQLPYEHWVAHYSGIDNAGASASDLAVDADGNVYVTGSGGTIKYDTNGNQMWVVGDGASKLALTADGNVIIAGSIDGGDTGQDYEIIKYDAAGNEQWVAHYNGPDNEDDIVGGLEVDADGNVYVTGASDGGDTSGDNATIKYDPSGNELWVARYEGGRRANALAVDADGNVLVTGSGYSAVKYDTYGNELWARIPGNGNYNGQAIAVDSDGNVHISGTSAVPAMDFEPTANFTIKGNSFGIGLWFTNYYVCTWNEVSAMTLDSEGNVYITLFCGIVDAYAQYSTAKYDSLGNELWVNHYRGSDSGGFTIDWPYDMEVDASGNVYVTGGSSGDGTGWDFATVKYDPSGSEVWVARFNGTGNGTDAAFALALDAEGNVYVAGRTTDSNGVPNSTTIKYLSDDLVLVLESDIDRDSDVDGRDLLRLLAVYGLEEEDENFDPLCDFEPDGIIDDKDVKAWVPHFGRTDCPCQIVVPYSS